MNLNVTSAAEACKVRREVIEKALKEGRFPGAFYSGESKRGVCLAFRTPKAKLVHHGGLGGT